MSISSSPWDFADGNQQFAAADGTQCLRYETESLNEVGMGGPLYGPCFWVKPGGVETLLHKTCGGPPIWQCQGNYAALPIWEYSRFRGWKACIGVIDIARSELVVFKKSFVVLQLEKFEDQMITGIDSPIYYPKILVFDITRAAVGSIISL